MDHHHHRGRMLLLHLRASDQFNSPVGRCLFGILQEQAVSDASPRILLLHLCTYRRMQIIKCLTRHVKPLEEAGAWVQVFGIKGPPQEIAGLNIKTAQMCAEAQGLFDSTTHDEEWELCMLKTIEDAIVIDFQYQSWIDRYSKLEVWGFQVYDLFPNETLPANGRVHVYYDTWTAYIWTSCRSKRTHLQEVLLHCVSLLTCVPNAIDLSRVLKRLGLDESLLLHSRTIINDMVSGISATVPFMLGDINASGKIALQKKRMQLAGYHLMWPLHVARLSAQPGSEEEAWLEGRLRFIDREMGIKFAGHLANKVKDKPWNLG